MKKPLKIISVDGTRGSGKSSQIRMLAAYFKSLGFMVSTLQAGHDPQSRSVTFQFIESFLPKDPKTMVILDGSIARPMVIDLLNGTPSIEVIDKSKHSMYDYERLNQKYGVVGLLFVMDDVQKSQERLLKKADLTGLGEDMIPNINIEKDIVSGMRTFNNHIASRSIVFHTFNIEPDDSIMAINKTVIDYLTEKYDIPVFQKSQDDW